MYIAGRHRVSGDCSPKAPHREKPGGDARDGLPPDQCALHFRAGVYTSTLDNANGFGRNARPWIELHSIVWRVAIDLGLCSNRIW